jgi:hypothetical protein
MDEKKYRLVSNPRDPHFLTLRSLQTYQGRARTERYIIEGACPCTPFPLDADE